MAKVIWHENAVDERQHVLLYGLYEFGEKAVIRLENRFRNYNAYLATNPRMGAVDEKLTELYGREIRGITVFKHFRLIYIIETENLQNEIVKILELWDTRANPDMLKGSIGQYFPEAESFE